MVSCWISPGMKSSAHFSLR